MSINCNLENILQDAIAKIDKMTSCLFSWNWLDTTGGSFSVRLPQINKDNIFAVTPTHCGFRGWNVIDDGLVVLNDLCNLSDHSISSYVAHPSAIVHNFVYQNFPLANAIIHTHSPYSLVFACAKQIIKPVTLHSHILGEVPCIDSDVDETSDRSVSFTDKKEEVLTSGIHGYQYVLKHFTSLLSDIKEKLGNRADELKRHGLGFTIYKHGIFIIARNLDEAFDNLIRIERNAQVQLHMNLL